MTFVIVLFFLCFGFIAWHKFKFALALLFFLLPTYLVRFHLGPLPTTLLEIMIWIVVAIWLIKIAKEPLISNFKFLISKNLSLSIAISLFLLAATISVFTAVDTRAALGEWKAFYIEPFLLFLVLTSVFSQKPIANSYELRVTSYVLLPLILSGLVTSLLAIYQHYTGWLVPSAFWENDNSYRVTAWYGFPNAVGLYLAPLYPLALYLLYQSFILLRKRNWKLETVRQRRIRLWRRNWGIWTALISSFLFLISSPFAIIFAKSTGALIGLAAGVAVLLFFWRRTRWWTVGIGLIGLIGLISPISPLRQELLLANRSGQIRVAMWGEAVELLRSRPLLGAGLASYQERVKPYHTTVNGEGIEIFHHPHNIFLTMYVNLGLLGLIGFVWILVWFYRIGFSAIKQFNNLTIKQLNTAHPTHFPISSFPYFVSLSFPYFLISSMSIIIIQGLVDSPYIKNDLAILFWLLPALLLIDHSQAKTV